MKIATILVLLFLSSAQADVHENLPCPNPGSVAQLCTYIAAQIPDTDTESSYEYLYQRVVYEASCVDIDNDQPKLIASKVQVMWNRYAKDLKCDGILGVNGLGQILKYAAFKNFDSFIVDAATVWKISLNEIDASDNKTTLDYIDDQIKRTGGEVQKKFKRYFELLRRSGAKFSHEL